MSRKIDARELLAALGGLLVLISLFLDWYERDGRAAFGGADVTGWQVFEALDLVLAALAVAAIATGAAGLGTIASLGPRSLLPLGLVLLLVIVVQLVSPPPVAWDADPATGAWLALAGAALVLLGGILSAARIDVTVNVGARDTRRRVQAADPRPTASAATAAPSPAAAAEPEPTQPIRPVDEA